MTAVTDAVGRYQSAGWKTVPVHRPGAGPGTCTCGRPDCDKPGKHPDPRHWPGGSADPGAFEGRNVGVLLGPDSGNLADVDLDCTAALLAAPHLLPPTPAAFGRGTAVTHHLYTVADGAAAFVKLTDPVLPGAEATVVELRWPNPGDEGRPKAVQTVFPPSLHHKGKELAWVRDGAPAAVPGADLVAAVRRVGAAVLVSRYARPKARHDLVLLLANLGVRAGWSDDALVVRFIAAVFAAMKDADKVDKVLRGEGANAVADARKRLRDGKPMTGLPALAKMLDPALGAAEADAVVTRVRNWLGLPDRDPPKPAAGGAKPSGGGGPVRYTPLPPWRPFPTEHLPAAVRGFVESVAAAMRCDPTFVALPALAVCGGMVGMTRIIRLKASWCEPAVIWAVVVGDSGTLKTPPYKRAVAPVIALQVAVLKAHRLALEAYRAELREYERRKKQLKDEDPGDPPAEPPCPRFYSRDTTVEALAGLLAQNPTRFLVGRDEASGWLASFNQYKSKGGSDQANWLELHALGTLCVDRKTGDPKTIFVDGVGVSIAGGIQPGVFRTALTPDHFSAGVPARLLFAYPPKRPKVWTDDDVDAAAEAGYKRLVEGLYGLLPHTDDGGNPYPVALPLTPEAKREWVAFYGRFAERQADAAGDLAAAFSKLKGYAARLALLHHVCNSVSAGEAGLELVGAASVRAGIALAEWFAGEAERVYQMLGEETEEAAVRELVETVTRLADRHGGRVTPRVLQRANQRKYRAAADAEAALESLVGLGLGRWEAPPPGPRGGHPPRAFVPQLPAPPADPDDDSSGEGVVSHVSHVTHRPGGERKVTTAPPADPTDGPRTSPSPPGAGVAAPAYGPAGDPHGPSRGEEAGVTCDRCDTTPAVGGGGDPVRVCDRTPGGVCGGGGASRRTPDTTGGGEGGCGSGRTGAQEVVSHVSHVTHLPEPNGAGASAPSSADDDPAGVLSHTALAPVTTPTGLGAVTAAVAAAGGPVGLDTETTGLDHARDRVRLLQLATPRGTFLIDVFPVGPAALAPVFEALAATGIVGHNLGFDLPFLMRLGFTPGRVVDTMLASQVLHAGDVVVKHGLRDVAARTLGLTLEKELQQADWAGTLTPDMLRYAALDAEVPLRAWPELAAELEAAELTAVAEIEFAALPCVAWAAVRGVGLDRVAWQALAADADAERARLREALDAAAPNGASLFGARNWDSPDDVKAALAAVGVVLEATDDDALAAVAHPLAGLVRDYRSAARLVTTYGRDWLRHVAPDGRVYATWKQIGAGASGRMSCKGPNLQQLPRDARYRRCFAAPPGRALVKADYSQIELRVAARLTGDARMREAYRTGEDLHTLTAKALLGKAEVTKADRQLAKAVNFGLLYGQGADGLRRYARAGYGVELTEAEAVRHRETFFRTYPGLRAWHRSVGDGALDTRTLAGRRRLGVTRYTEKLNTPIQGAGADGLKRALALLWELRGQCPDAFPVLVVHDEVVVECDADRAEEAAVWLRDAMRDGMGPLVHPVPVEVEVDAGPTWGG